MTRCRHNPPCQRREYWGRGGAGVLFTCSEDGTVLLLLRAAWVEQGGTWGIPGGGIGEGFYRTPVQPLTDMRVFRKKAKEEVEEECGSLPPGVRSLRADLPFTEYEDCGFRYVTFILDITKKQKATWAPFSADGENDAFVWFPLDAVKKGRPLPDENGDLHDIHFGVTFTMGKLPRSNPRRPTTAERTDVSPRLTARRTDPALWEAVKREVTAGSKGGVRGEWSARKAQLAVALYKKRGGDYIGPKSPRNALAKWTREDWRTRSGKPSLVTGERYLPARAIEALTPAEYAATTRAKRAGLRRDEQFTAQPERIREKTARYRRNPTGREAEAMRAIRANLTPDLLAGEYRACATTHPMAGHCSVATEALYFTLGGKAAGYTPMNVRHEGVSHWYLRTPDGRYLDPTADQFDTPVDYASGRGRGFPTPRQGHAEPPPSKRAAVLLSRIGARKR